MKSPPKDFLSFCLAVFVLSNFKATSLAPEDLVVWTEMAECESYPKPDADIWAFQLSFAPHLHSWTQNTMQHALPLRAEVLNLCVCGEAQLIAQHWMSLAQKHKNRGSEQLQ